jgi:hypothetical protein
MQIMGIGERRLPAEPKQWPGDDVVPRTCGAPGGARPGQAIQCESGAESESTFPGGDERSHAHLIGARASARASRIRAGRAGSGHRPPQGPATCHGDAQARYPSEGG